MAKKLNWIEIAALYIGIIMGAGFASGRECWQFFGVFGVKGYYGGIVVALGFVLFACMLTYIARSKKTAKLGSLISPFNNNRLDGMLGTILAIFYYFDFIVMSAAGGSLLNQEFGISKVIGGLLIAVFVILTVIGNFEKISGVFRILVPFLFVIAVLMIILVVKADFPEHKLDHMEPGAMSPNWLISSITFLAYNTLAMITMSGNTAINAKNTVNIYIGATTGALCLGCLILGQLTALLTDMPYTASLDLPMLGYSLRISPVLNAMYAIVLFGSVYSTGASCYFGFTTILPENDSKKRIIIIGAILGFALGLTGFQNLVEFLYPTQGYIGLLYLGLITINFINELRKNKKCQSS